MKEYFNLIYKDSKESYYRYLESLVKNNEKKFIVTVNPETIINASKNEEMKAILLNKNNSLVPDGISIVKKAHKYKINIKERITGIDIASKLLEIGNKNQKKIYLLGSKEEVLNDLVRKLTKEYPNLKIIGYTNGYVSDKDKVFKEIIKLKPDICLVALGIPSQELLINKYINEFKKGIFIGVGGSFDVLSGNKKRAPKLFINLNLEWLYRIIKEPKRIKRFWENNVKFVLKK